MRIIQTLLVKGNLTDDPVYHAGQGERKSLWRIDVATTPRRYNQQTGQWEDASTYYTTAVAYDHLADTLSELAAQGSFRKGVSVIATGHQQAAPSVWMGQDGHPHAENVLVIETLSVDDVAMWRRSQAKHATQQTAPTTATPPQPAPAGQNGERAGGQSEPPTVGQQNPASISAPYPQQAVESGEFDAGNLWDTPLN